MERKSISFTFDLFWTDITKWWSNVNNNSEKDFSCYRCAKGNVNGQAEDSILDQNSDKPNKTQEDEIPDTSQTEMDIENEQNDSEQGETEKFIPNQGSSGKNISLTGKRRGQQTNRSKNNPMQEENIGNRNNPHPIRQPQPITTAV